MYEIFMEDLDLFMTPLSTIHSAPADAGFCTADAPLRTWCTHKVTQTSAHLCHPQRIHR